MPFQVFFQQNKCQFLHFNFPIFAQVFLVYASLVCFVYLATDGFQNNAPFVFTLPVVVLGWFTLWTRMPRRTRILTAVSFFTLGQFQIQFTNQIQII
jgi:hypothetical protein